VLKFAFLRPAFPTVLSARRNSPIRRGVELGHTLTISVQTDGINPMKRLKSICDAIAYNILSRAQQGRDKYFHAKIFHKINA
jgi:hypothetical protein